MEGARANYEDETMEVDETVIDSAELEEGMGLMEDTRGEAEERPRFPAMSAAQLRVSYI